METSDYRRDYAAYNSARAAELAEAHAGLKAEPRLEPVEDRYADLWTREAIEELTRALEETPAQFETERAGLRALAFTARFKHLEGRASALLEELGRCEAAARVEWGGERLWAGALPNLMAGERDAARRRELAARWFDALRPCDDLRAELLNSHEESARMLGFESLRTLHEEAAEGTFDVLATAGELFLARTSAAYLSGIARWAMRTSPAVVPGDLSHADALFFEHQSEFDARFPARRFREAYAVAMAALGVRAETQPNVKVDVEGRPLKKGWTACFDVAPPEDVRLIVGAAEGSAGWFRESFREAGRGQFFAWASRDLAARHPEFVHAPDGTTAAGHASLFSDLFRDEAWLADFAGLRPAEAGEVARLFVLRDLYGARRDCARLRYGLALSSARDVRSESLSDLYVESHGEATGFRHDAATRLSDSPDWFHAAGRLRARAFAAGFAEHLRARHGRRWYSSRAARDELIDVWNVSSRHSVEELARMIWGGALDLELLAGELTKALEI